MKEDNQAVIKALNMYGRVPEMWELLEEIERLNNIIDKGKIYCEDVIQEHKNGEYNVSTTQLAIEEHKKNIKSLLNILNGDLENYWRSDKE